MPITAMRNLNRTTRGFGAVVLAVLLAVAMLAVPSVTSRDAQADAAETNNGIQFGDCAFRRGTGLAESWATQMCWLDMSDMVSEGHKIKRVGDYTIEFDLTIAKKNSSVKLIPQKNPTWAPTAFARPGSGFFERYPSSSVSDVLQMEGAGDPFVRFSMTNIVVKRNGVPDPLATYRFSVADGESTGAGGDGEMISVEGGKVGAPIRLTPSGSKEACTGTDAIFGAANEPKRSSWGELADGRQAGFVCYTRTAGTYGTWVVGVDNPKTLTFAMGSDGSGTQGIVLGIALGRVAFPADGLATVETALEQAATGVTRDEPTYSAFLQDGTQRTALPSQPGSSTTVLRRVNNSGVAQDRVGFESTLTPADTAFSRYNPVWKCTFTSASGASQTTMIKSGSVPAGFSLQDNTATATSTLLLPASENRVSSCTVNWESKYKPAELQLNKTVGGNAAGFSTVVLDKFALHYACIAPAGFSDAYPDVKLEGRVMLERGSSTRLVGLPQGAKCTVTEEVGPGTGEPPAGTDLQLSWNGVVVPSAKTPITVDLTDPAGKTPSSGSNVVVESGVVKGTARADNNYTFRPGSILFSKEIIGEPVLGGQIGGTYRFNLACNGTTVKRDFTLDLNQATPTGSIRLDNIPVEQDCVITPLTDLDDAQRQTMKFVDRVATINKVALEPDDAGGFHFRIPVADAGKEPQQELHFRTTYAYLTFPLVIRAEINGLAAGNADLDQATFNVNYRCEVAGRPATVGAVTLSRSNPEATVAEVPAGAQCTVWEDTPADTVSTVFQGATVRSSNAADEVTTLSNDAAKTQPITVIRKVSGSDQNLVTIANTFDPKLGTVDLKKIVNSTVTGELPGSYRFTFDCGLRNIPTAVTGQSRTVELTGTVEVAAGQTVRLKSAEAGANDQNSFMGVPYGNTCTFNEETPNVSGGILFATNVQDVSVAVREPQNLATVTNSFTPAGNGLTVSLRTDGRETLKPTSLQYNLVCSNQFSIAFTLTPGQSREFGAGDVPQGTTCRLTESGDAPTRVTEDGREYPIGVSSEYLYAADAGAGRAVGNGDEFVIGNQSTMDVRHNYDFVPAPIAGVKEVVFDDPNNLISDQRRAIKSQRDFLVSLVCQNPDGTQGVNISTTVRQDQQPGGTTSVVGADCTVIEQDSTTAAGISLTKSINVNGDVVTSGLASFTVDSDQGVELKFVNTYSRRTTTIDLRKRAVLPTDSIRTQYQAAGHDLQAHLYDHTFNLECRDPETGDEAVLQTQTASIKGEGEVKFENVPVGADCTITGDKFGSLALNMKDGADELKAFLRPTYVDWIVDREGGNAYPDQALVKDKTTSPVFLTVDDSERNSVRLDNHYEYETSTVKLSKSLTGAAGDIAELGDDASFNFLMQCKAIGYQTSNPGETSFISEKLRPADAYVLPTSLVKKDFVNNTYVSGEATVPAGSLCTFEEQAASNVPSALTVSPVDNVVLAYAPDPSATGATDLHFVNQVNRRKAPVNIAVFNSGYLVGAAPEGYIATVRCNDPAATEINQAFPLASLNGLEMPRTTPAPNGGVIVDLPVGVDCVLDLSASPALKARGRLEVTAGERTPLAQFGQWQGSTADVPASSLSELDLQTVTADQKQYMYKFATQPTLPSDSTALTLGADIYHPRATYDIAFKKTAANAEAGPFTFSQSCGQTPGTFQLKAGDTAVIKGVPVDSDCSVAETDDGNEQTDAVMNITASGDLISPRASDERIAAFTVLPVSAPTDLSRSGDRWSLTVNNAFPGLGVEKTIEGTPFGNFVGELLDRTLLPSDATTMRVTYTVKNTGEFTLTDFTFTDPSLAGMQVRADGARVTIDDSGSIPASVCDRPTELAAGGEFACTFDVEIPASPQENWFYPAGESAEVTVTAQADAGGTQSVQAADRQGAFKPSAALGWLLPESGQQTMVLILLLGLALFGFGAWRVSRRESPEGGELIEV